ncbi:hypothetical protein BGX28_000559 [Mortierella sp. GBA30]|nr:hypothetical protein BGX28_000559 [Mortierella sp. GBA30]
MPAAVIEHSTQMFSADHSSDQLTDHDDSQLTGQTPAGHTDSAVSSKSNLSSFLNSIRNRSKDNAENYQEDGKEGGNCETDRRLSDLREQKLQKKINRLQDKAQKQLRKQQQCQQQHQECEQGQHQTQSLPPVSYSLAVASAWSAPSSPSFHAGASAPLQEQQQRVVASKAKSADAVFSGAATPKSINSNTSSPAFPLSNFTTLGMQGNNDISTPPFELQAFNFSPTSSNIIATNIKQSTPPSSGRSSKLSFIRGKAGFAWLEKRLPPAASDLDEETLNDTTWTYQHGQLLNEMEIEAAKGYVDRITEQHYLYKDVMGGNYHAPIDLAFKRVLENGCGAGDWTLDMASEMAETDFVGCPQIMFTTNAEKSTPVFRPRGLLGADQSQLGSNPTSTLSASAFPPMSGSGATSTTGSTLSGSAVRPNIRPRNCYFHPDVPLNRLPFQNEQFDFVYQRRQSVVLMSTEWQRTILELFRVLKRGGWVEILEPDLSLRGGGELCQLAGEYCVGIFEAMGRNPKVIHEMQYLLESAGFVNVSVKVWSIPLGWGGVIGQAMLANQKQFVNELEPIYVRQGHGDSQEYRDLTKGIFEEAVEKKAYINYHVIMGQKPASTSDRLLHQQIQKQKEEEEHSSIQR